MRARCWRPRSSRAGARAPVSAAASVDALRLASVPAVALAAGLSCTARRRSAPGSSPAASTCPTRSISTRGRRDGRRVVGAARAGLRSAGAARRPWPSLARGTGGGGGACRQRRWSPLAWLAVAALPWYAFFQGHPLRIRYMVPLVVASAVLVGLAVGRLPRWRRGRGGPAAVRRLVDHASVRSEGRDGAGGAVGSARRASRGARSPRACPRPAATRS